MQAEERIKELIIAKYGNVRAFATESGISYTTVRSILERGIINIIDNAMMFDGKPLSEDDKRAIRGIIAGYMSSKED